jgi:hypothetical protein
LNGNGDEHAPLAERVGRLEGVVERLCAEMRELHAEFRGLRGQLWALMATTILGPLLALIASRMLG